MAIRGTRRIGGRSGRGRASRFSQGWGPPMHQTPTAILPFLRGEGPRLAPLVQLHPCEVLGVEIHLLRVSAEDGGRLQKLGGCA